MDTYNLSFPDVAIDAILATGYELQNAGYIFRGVASEQIGTPSERSWVLAGEGETGHGFTSPIPKGYIGVCVFNGTSWTGKLLKCVSIDSTPTNGSTNAVSSGGTYTSINQLATMVNEALDNLTFTDSTPSAFLGEYITEKISTTNGGIERILTYFTLLAATAEKAGLLSAADKQKIDSFLGIVRSLEIDDTTAYADLGTKIVESIKATIGGTEETISTFQLLAATASKAGLLSASDKAKLDAILTNLRSLEIDDTTAYADLGDKIVESIKATIGGTEETISTFQILAATASKAGLMSAADKAKLDALASEGYLYAGVATPSGTPAATTGKVFYLAIEAGTYTNYGGLELSRGIHVITFNGSTWSSIILIGIDDSLHKNSNNIIESGAVYDSVIPLDEAISNKTPQAVVNIINGVFVNSSGSLIENPNYLVARYDCSENKKYLVTVYRRTTASGSYHVNWFNSSNGLISHDVPFETEADGITTVILEAPEGASYCEINSHISYLGWGCFSLIADTVDSENLLVGTKKVFNPKSIEYIAPSSVSESKYMGYSLTESSNDGFNIMYYAVEGGNYYLLNTGMNTLNNIAAVYWFAANDMFICAEPINDTWKYENYVMKAPDGAVKAAVNSHKGNTPYGVNLAKIKDFYPIGYDNDNAILTAAVSEFDIVNKDETIENSFLHVNSVTESNNNFESWIYSVTPNTVYAFSGKYPASVDIGFLAFLNSDKALLAFLPYKGSLSEAVEYTNQGFITPSNASYVLINVRKDYIDRFNLKKVTKQLPMQDVKSINEINNVLADYENAAYNEVVDGKFMKPDGTEGSVSTAEYYEYTVSEGEQYHIIAKQSAGWYLVRLYVIEDGEGNVIKTGPYKATAEDSGDFDEIVIIPEGAAKMYVNNDKRLSVYYSVGKYVGYIDVSGMQETLDSMSAQSKGSMKVVISGLNSSFYIRASYNKEKDIILTHWINYNGLISFNAAYIGEKELSDSEIMKSDYKVSEHTDSTSPIRDYTQYWHLYAQHGYPVPYFANSMNMSADDVDAEWEDQLNRHYKIGKVTDSYVWLLPVIYQDANGHYTRDWHSLATSEAIVSLTHVSGGTHTSSISFEEGDILQEQLRPVMSVDNRTLLCDGKEVKDAGTYYCNEFQVNETEVGYDPATIQNWFGGENGKPDLTGAQIQAIFTYSYNYKGAQCCVNTTINILREAKGKYGGTQQQFFVDKGDYKAMFMMPKAATINGVDLSKPFNSPSLSLPNIYVYRNASNLKDVDNPVDRQIGFLYDDDNDAYLVGMAAGLSIVSGDTITSKRNINIPVGKEVMHLSPANTNKFYVVAIDSSIFESGYFPVGYFKEINYYVCYFDPAENTGQVYWYKDGDSYMIYAHCQSEQHVLGINVPKFMDGLGLEIVEKTSDTDLLTDRIANGKFFVNYNTSDANYIVLKTK